MIVKIGGQKYDCEAFGKVWHDKRIGLNMTVAFLPAELVPLGMFSSRFNVIELPDGTWESWARELWDELVAKEDIAVAEREAVRRKEREERTRLYHEKMAAIHLADAARAAERRARLEKMRLERGPLKNIRRIACPNAACVVRVDMNRDETVAWLMKRLLRGEKLKEVGISLGYKNGSVVCTKITGFIKARCPDGDDGDRVVQMKAALEKFHATC
jgi:hypothetical protein